MTHKPHYDMYIVSCCEGGGIYHYKLKKGGDLGSTRLVEKTLLDYPMYAVIDRNRLHVLQREVFDNHISGYLSFEIMSDGRLSSRSETLSTHGVVACHLAVDGNDIYCANYVSGSITKLTNTTIYHIGNSLHPSRQSSPHVHQAVITPDGNYVCAVDLGTDKIVVYDRQLCEISSASVLCGHGVRHMVFSPDGRNAFCANELQPTVTSFSYTGGKLSPISSYSLGVSKTSFAAAIRISRDGKKLFVSNRGDNSISCFDVNGGELRLRYTVPCGGNWPRDFILTPDESAIICVNERSGEVTFLSLTENLPKLSEAKLTISEPLCVVFG